MKFFALLPAVSAIYQAPVFTGGMFTDNAPTTYASAAPPSELIPLTSPKVETRVMYSAPVALGTAPTMSSDGNVAFNGQSLLPADAILGDMTGVTTTPIPFVHQKVVMRYKLTPLVTNLKAIKTNIEVARQLDEIDALPILATYSANSYQ